MYVLGDKEQGAMLVLKLAVVLLLRLCVVLSVGWMCERIGDYLDNEVNGGA